MKLINNIDDIKRHIVVSATLDFKKVLPHCEPAERKIVINQIGIDQYDTIVIHVYDPESNAAIDRVKHLFEKAVSNYGLYLAMPTINTLITNSGTKTAETTESKNADWKDKLDLNRSLIRSYNEAVDDAFEIMEDSVQDFPEWRDSKYYTIFKDLIVSQTRLFNDHFGIGNRRQTFVALKPMMREIERQYLKGMLGDCTLDFLKLKSVDPIVLEAQEIARMAVVALTVAKASTTGTFSFSESGMTYVSEVMPWEKKSELSKEDRQDLKADRQNAGEQYLKALKAHIVSHPEVFTCYEDRQTDGITKQIIRKKSGLTL